MSPSETPLPTFEEAKLCPKCGKTGEDRKIIPVPPSSYSREVPRGSMLHHIYCTTELCRWFNTCWMVMVLPDGSVPAPKNHTGEKKTYVGFEGHDEIANRLIEGIKRQREAEVLPGAEVRNRSF